MLNKNDVLKPFQELADNFRNILIGLRLVEKVNHFPDSTLEEQKLQCLFDLYGRDFIQSKELFKQWLLTNGLKDIQKYIRKTLENVCIYFAQKSKTTLELQEFCKKVESCKYGKLIHEAENILSKNLDFKQHMKSLNFARNCLVHSNGVVKENHCNDSSSNRLIIYGQKFKLFFKTDSQEVALEMGKPGPENASLMLGAEDFQIEFPLGSQVAFSLQEFMHIFSTCVFIDAEIKEILK